MLTNVLTAAPLIVLSLLQDKMLYVDCIYSEVQSENILLYAEQELKVMTPGMSHFNK